MVDIIYKHPLLMCIYMIDMDFIKSIGENYLQNCQF